ncbi:MAG: SpoIID/LytB domain-containing protein [Deltaproteobacteria bacterium]|nr:SpoIID/LytB domain-containing protein [Deltaproteobacteria bacterium]
MSSRRTFLTLAAAALASVRARQVFGEGAAGSQPPTASPAQTGAVQGSAPRESLFSGAPEPDDPLELLYSRRLSFDEGQPLITVRVLEGQTTVVLRAPGQLTASARTEKGKTTPLPRQNAGKFTLDLRDGRPGVGASWVELEQVRYADHEGRDEARALWESRGVKVRLATVGDVYGIAGHVVDTRRTALLAEGDATEDGARAQAKELTDKWGLRAQIHRELAGRPGGRIALLDAKGKLVGEGEGAIELRCNKGLAVDDVEFGMGYAFHGYERRVYPGRLYACIDATGKLAVVAAVPMERLVKGVVPSEIFAKAHKEALKSQAVTARGEVLAKVGARHLGDPYLLCAEQHCQVYKGLAAEERGTDAAVDATRGQALFARSTGGEPSRLVDSVYSAVCGGFTEDNDAVWGGPADPSLRGRPDFDPRAKDLAAFADGVGDALVNRFVHTPPTHTYCTLSGMAPKDKVRWQRRFAAKDLDALCVAYNVGEVKALNVEGRGVSGRARALAIEGSLGHAKVHGELTIRRLFKNLNSGMFVVEREGDEWVFTGGGWGHGSGMCQTGAIGRAKAGQTYRQILGWYYSGAAPQKIY